MNKRKPLDGVKDPIIERFRDKFREDGKKFPEEPEIAKLVKVGGWVLREKEGDDPTKEYLMYRISKDELGITKVTTKKIMIDILRGEGLVESYPNGINRMEFEKETKDITGRSQQTFSKLLIKLIEGGVIVERNGIYDLSDGMKQRELVMTDGVCLSSGEEIEEEGEEGTEEGLSENREMEDVGVEEGEGEITEERSWEIERQRIREELELRAKVDDEREERRVQREKEKEDIKELIDRWLDQLPVRFQYSPYYCYTKEKHLSYSSIPINHKESIIDTDGKHFILLSMPETEISYFGQTLCIEDNWRFKKYAEVTFPVITKLYFEMKKQAQEDFEKKTGFPIEDVFRNTGEKYREGYEWIAKWGCTDSEVIKKLEDVRRMLKEIRREKYS